PFLSRSARASAGEYSTVTLCPEDCSKRGISSRSELATAPGDSSLISAAPARFGAADATNSAVAAHAITRFMMASSIHLRRRSHAGPLRQPYSGGRAFGRFG